ncbi:MAG: DeoR/GlpR family DNA-binding transcription regulator [Solobacterium sp.]|jgi:DeoR family fructose operon transcriptional repressor|nr:DeoR/GlpR family DNA-binding transcription regulator [Solobacterium sp.]MCH4205107.1 DeoR/GlpR family DNA-binding transcription regulator [Solobacterium sp.]MCH4226700.1 DeoR/GlpR family DNA-binding transcription regulator [Solobacterium sp.]MCH4281971.1 DeoR/GlpR family DNA-binding transcription regulator [Solobacterium sp.]
MKQERWQQILDLAKEKEAVTVAELCRQLGASEATIRRDLQEMEDLHLLNRFHGGAKLNESQYIEPAMALKNETQKEQKKQVAYCAAKLIHDNQMVYLDAGSTTCEMIKFITAKNITVVTPGIPQLTVLGQRGINTIVLGGSLYWSTEAITGKQALAQLSDLYFDTAFVGTNGIHEQFGFSTSNELEAETKAMAIHHAKNPYVITDSSKFNLLRPCQFAKLDEAVIITDHVPDFDLSLIHFILPDGSTDQKKASPAETR